MRGPQSARTQRARSLRKADNDAERALWSVLRNRQLNGAKFTRQLSIGPYFADFACREEHLVVELDGSQHADSLRDAIRDRYLERIGYRVLRFWNHEVFEDTDVVLEHVVAVLEGRA